VGKENLEALATSEMCTDLSQCPFRYKKLQILHTEYRKFNNSNMAILLTPDDKKCQEHESSDAVLVADEVILAHVRTQHDIWPTFCQKTSVSTHRGALRVDNTSYGRIRSSLGPNRPMALVATPICYGAVFTPFELNTLQFI